MPDGGAGRGRRGECAFPFGRDGWIGVEPGQPITEFLVAFGQGGASPWRRPGRVDLLHRPDQRREVARGLDRVDLIDRNRLAFDPGVDLPEPRILGARATLRDRTRNVD